MYAADVVSVTAAAVHSMWSATRAIQQRGQQTNNVLPVRRPRMMVCVWRGAGAVAGLCMTRACGLCARFYTAPRLGCACQLDCTAAAVSMHASSSTHLQPVCVCTLAAFLWLVLGLRVSGWRGGCWCVIPCAHTSVSWNWRVRGGAVGLCWRLVPKQRQDSIVINVHAPRSHSSRAWGWSVWLCVLCWMTFITQAAASAAAVAEQWLVPPVRYHCRSRCAAVHS